MLNEFQITANSNAVFVESNHHAMQYYWAVHTKYRQTSNIRRKLVGKFAENCCLKLDIISSCHRIMIRNRNIKETA